MSERRVHSETGVCGEIEELSSLAPQLSGSALRRHAAASPDVYRHTPTLMAGEKAGSQGEVLVWAPEKGRIATYAVTSAAVLFLGAGAHLMLRSAELLSWILAHLPLALALSVTMIPAAAAAFAFFYLVNSLVALPALWRPCYVTTDTAGIGVTTLGGSTAIRWAEVTACGRYDLLQSVLLYTSTRGAIHINTCGYQKSEREALCGEVETRAELTEEDRPLWRRVLYCGTYAFRMRAGYRLRFPDSLTAPPARDEIDSPPASIAIPPPQL